MCRAQGRSTVTPVEIESKTSFRSQRSTTRSPRSVYIIISVFVIAETFLKCLIVMCYCTFFIQETIKKNDCTKNTVWRNFMKAGQNISSDSKSDSY